MKNWFRDACQGWDRFWFSPADAATLATIRIFAGAMLLYTHFVWMLELEGFFGEAGWLSKEFVFRYHDSAYAWSHLYWIESPALLWATHLIALCIFASLMVGFRSRLSAAFAALLTISYAHRASGALFGLDQINGFLALYLIVGPCGDAFSVDAWLAKKNAKPKVIPKVSCNIAIRLMQIHLCIVYLFAGCGKLFGQSWWEGTALWGAFANLEYQTLDMTWTASRMWIIDVMTHVTLFWEVSYIALIWPRLSRPIMLLLAIPLHLGIAMCMGMVTFGVVMLIANLAFVSPEFIRNVSGRLGSMVNATELTGERTNPPTPKFHERRRTRQSQKK